MTGRLRLSGPSLTISITVFLLSPRLRPINHPGENAFGDDPPKIKLSYIAVWA
jgi:hypothetical protein